jgi:hypothetical protein
MNLDPTSVDALTVEDLERFLDNLARQVPLKTFLTAAVASGLTVGVDQATKSMVLQRAPELRT